mmetsp:Transcript_126236/g.315594  ORF Transcript_126236/g.315594 Transcript_126236/m.315594 type:complete len:270 (+) Transcript_126236:1-810(+)
MLLILPPQCPKEVPSHPIWNVGLVDPGAIVGVRQLLHVGLTQLLHPLGLTVEGDKHLQVLAVESPHHHQMPVDHNKIAEDESVNIVAEPLQQPLHFQVLLLPVRSHHGQAMQEGRQVILWRVDSIGRPLEKFHHPSIHRFVKHDRASPGTAEHEGSRCQGLCRHGRKLHIEAPGKDIEKVTVPIAPLEPCRVSPVHLQPEQGLSDQRKVRSRVTHSRKLLPQDAGTLQLLVLPEDLLHDCAEDSVMSISQLPIGVADLRGSRAMELALS